MSMQNSKSRFEKCNCTLTDNSLIRRGVHLHATSLGRRPESSMEPLGHSTILTSINDVRLAMQWVHYYLPSHCLPMSVQTPAYCKRLAR